MVSPDLSLVANLNLRRRDFDRQIRQIESRSINLNTRKGEYALGRITGKADEFEKSLAASNARVIAFGASVAVIEGVRRGFMRLLSVTSQVESSLAQINSIFGRTQKTIKAFGNDLFDIAKNTGQSFDQVAQTAQEFARQGLSVERTLERTKNALILTRLTTLTTDKAVDGLTATLNGFQKQALTSAQVLNKLRAVETSFAVGSADLIEALSRSASVAQDANLSFEELLGSVTAIKQRTGLGGATIGQGLKTALTRINIPSRIEELKRLGVEIDQSSTGLERLRAVATAFRAAQDAGESERATQIGIAVAGQFQISKISPLLADLASSYSVVEEATMRATNATNEAIVANEQLNKTIEATRNKLTQNLDQVFSKFSDVGGGREAILFILDNLNKLFDSIQGIKVEGANAFDGLFFGTVRLAKEWGLLGDLAKGFFNILTGPGLVAGVAIIANLFSNTLVQGGKSLLNLLGINKATKEREKIQQTINILLANASAEEMKNFNNAKSVAEQKQIVLRLMERQLAAQRSMEGQALKVAEAFRRQGIALAGTSTADFGVRRMGAKGLTRNPKAVIPGMADGLLPAVIRESNAIKQGVGGASASAKPKVIENFNYGGGKTGPAVVNTDEYIVKHPKGDGVFNRDMVSQMGLPSGAQKVNFAMGNIGMAGILSKAIQAKEKRQFFGMSFKKKDGTDRSGRFLLSGGVSNNLLDRKGAKTNFYHKDIPLDKKVLPLLDIGIYNKQLKLLMSMGISKKMAKKMAAEKAMRSASLKNVKSIRTGGGVFNAAEGYVGNMARGLDNREVQRVLARKKSGQPLTDTQFKKLSYSIENQSPAIRNLKMTDYGNLSEIHREELNRRVSGIREKFVPQKASQMGGSGDPLVNRERRAALDKNITRGTSTVAQRVRAERTQEVVSRNAPPVSNRIDPVKNQATRVDIDAAFDRVIRERETAQFLNKGILPTGANSKKILNTVIGGYYENALQELAANTGVDINEIKRIASDKTISPKNNKIKREILQVKRIASKDFRDLYVRGREELIQTQMASAAREAEASKLNISRQLKGGKGMLGHFGFGLDKMYQKEMANLSPSGRGILEADLNQRKVKGADNFRNAAFMGGFALSMLAPTVGRMSQGMGASEDTSSRLESALAMAGTGLVFGSILGKPGIIAGGLGGLAMGAITGGKKEDSNAQKLAKEFETLQEVLNVSRNNLNSYLQVQSQLNDLYASGNFSGRQVFELQKQSMESLAQLNIDPQKRMALASATNPFERGDIAAQINREINRRESEKGFSTALAGLLEGAIDSFEKKQSRTKFLKRGVANFRARSIEEELSTNRIDFSDKQRENLENLILSNVDYSKVLKEVGGDLDGFTERFSSSFEEITDKNNLIKTIEDQFSSIGISLSSLELKERDVESIKSIANELNNIFLGAGFSDRIRSLQLAPITAATQMADSQIGQRQVRAFRMRSASERLSNLDSRMASELSFLGRKGEIETRQSLFGGEGESLRQLEMEILKAQSEENLSRILFDAGQNLFGQMEDIIKDSGQSLFAEDIQQALQDLSSGGIKSIAQLEEIKRTLSRISTADDGITNNLIQLIDLTAEGIEEAKITNKFNEERLRLTQNQERILETTNKILRETGVNIGGGNDQTLRERTQRILRGTTKDEQKQAGKILGEQTAASISDIVSAPDRLGETTASQAMLEEYNRIARLESREENPAKRAMNILREFQESPVFRDRASDEQRAAVKEIERLNEELSQGVFSDKELGIKRPIGANPTPYKEGDGFMDIDGWNANRLPTMNWVNLDGLERDSLGAQEDAFNRAKNARTSPSLSFRLPREAWTGDWKDSNRRSISRGTSPATQYLGQDRIIDTPTSVEKESERSAFDKRATSAQLDADKRENDANVAFVQAVQPLLNEISRVGTDVADTIITALTALKAAKEKGFETLQAEVDSTVNLIVELKGKTLDEKDSEAIKRIWEKMENLERQNNGQPPRPPVK